MDGAYSQVFTHLACRRQSGYGAFSVSPGYVDRVVTCIQHQRKHHTLGTVNPRVEFTGSPED